MRKSTVFIAETKGKLDGDALFHVNVTGILRKKAFFTSLTE